MSLAFPQLMKLCRDNKVELVIDGDGIAAFGLDAFARKKPGKSKTCTEDELVEAVKRNKDHLLTILPRMPETPAYTYVRHKEDLGTAVDAVAAGERIVAVDTETTGLSVRKDRVRLMQIATADHVYLVDCFAVDPRQLWPVLAKKTVVFHNAFFDLGMLARLGFTPRRVRDTLILSALLTAGTHAGNGLQDCAERYLRLYLPKEQQKADWGMAELTREQLDYAAIDAAVTRQLYLALKVLIAEAGMDEVAKLEQRRVLPAVQWLAATGPLLDWSSWIHLAKAAESERDRLAVQLDKLAPTKPATMHKNKGGAKWCWGGHQQVKAALKLAGVDVPNVQADTLATVNHPMAELLIQHAAVDKRANTYGRNWKEHLGDDGRVYAGWRQCGAGTGRFSCREPNLQNLPKLPEYRRCFVAPPGRVLVKADYSQIELRLAAVIAPDQDMIAAFQRGDDLHRITAQRLMGREGVSDEERRLSKPINFGLIYGLQPRGLVNKVREYGLDITEEQAAGYSRTFFATWRGIRAWHRALAKQAFAAKFKRRDDLDVRTLLGRRVLVDPWGHNAVGTAASCIVQGSAGDGMKQALALLYERRDRCPGAFPVLSVHDEIVVECDEDKAEQVSAWLKAAMIDGMQPLLGDVPCEVELSVEPTWGGPRNDFPPADPEPVEIHPPAPALHPHVACADRPELPPATGGIKRKKTYPAGILYNADCRDVLALLRDNDVSAVITDPPYGQGYDCARRHGKNSKRGYAPTIAGDKDMTLGQSVIDECFRRGWPVCAFSNPMLPPWNGPWRFPLVWNKGGGVGGGDDCRRTWKRTHERITYAGFGILNGKRDSAVLEFKIGSASMKYHLTQKPLPLMIYLIEKLTQPGDTVLDPFAGSGTTLLAAMLTGRRFIGVEVDEGYYATIKLRLAEAIRQKAA
jgi:DNA polymerase-1